MNNQISLIGFMGCGKTTVGKALAQLTGRMFTDTDELIVAEEGISINEIFVRYGERYFRDLETAQIKKLLTAADLMVVSAGGGLPVREENRKLLKKLGQVVFLETSREELIRRLQGDCTRPMLRGGLLEERIDTLMKERLSLYLDAATFCVHTDGKSPFKIAAEIAERVAG